MELSIRDWLLVVGVLMLLFVAYDGFKRSRKERQNRVRVSKSAKQRAKRARVSNDVEEQQEDSAVQTQPRLANADLGIASKEIQIDEHDKTVQLSAAEIPLPSFSASNSEQNTASFAEKNSSGGLPETSLTEDLESTNLGHFDSSSSLHESEILEDDSHVFDERDEVDPLFENPFDADPSRLEKTAAKKKSVQQTHKSKDIDDRADEYQHSLAFNQQQDADEKIDEILVLSVVANDSEGFSGEDLLHILKACDCRLTEKNIFQRFEGKDGQGRVQFSVVNMLEPGTFDANNISHFSTPGVSFFLRLPGPHDPAVAYDCMTELAQCLVRNLKGSLKDEMHSAATEQTIAHNRQRILDYQQRKLLPA